MGKIYPIRDSLSLFVTRCRLIQQFPLQKGERMKKGILIVSAICLLSGCASTSDPLQIGENQYVVSSSSYWTGTSGTAQQEYAIKQAQEFCAKQGKILKVTSMQDEDGVFGATIASAKIAFTCEEINKEEEPVELANGIYMLAGSTSGYQGIRARYELLKAASAFCAKKGMKVLPVSDTRESGVNFTSITGKANTGNSADSALQNTSADIFFKCVRN